MWELTNQDIVIILSVLSGCLIFYNLWGYFIGKILISIAITYSCIYILINENYNTLLTKINDSIIKAGENIPDLFSLFYHQLLSYLHQFGGFVKKFYQKHFSKMERRGRNSYQLSSESSISMSNNSQLGLTSGVSPMSKNSRRSIVSGSENSVAKRLSPSPSSSFGGNKHWENSSYHLNGDINGSMQHLWKKSPTKYSNNDAQDDSLSARREEILFRSYSTPWNADLGGKNSSSAGIKTVQTVAGPLLSSSRYNIDSKAYSTLSSGRLTKYASDADTKLLYQSQYSTGQFPKVNLYCSPTPTLNAKTVKARSPVTVRIAPPETIKFSPPEKQKLLANIYRSEKKSPQSVVQVLKEISLKRHASMDDISLELVKKQRTESHREEYESFDEGTQKRTREDLSKSEDDISIENTSLRPVKRTKVPSCNDILSSLSSSTNVMTGSSGVKRKADLSRSGTPEVGKHFKSFDSNRRSNSVSPRVIINKSSSPSALSRSSSAEFLDACDDDVHKKQTADSPKLISQQSSPISSNSKVHLMNNSKSIGRNSSQLTQLKDKLFMRAEPQNIDKIKTLLEEHDVTGKFGGDDADEIKQSDILIMRQTSMKARLKSMFDAISGKASSEIDPSVVIQADEVNDRPATTSAPTPVTPTAQSQPVLTSLNSSTSTTHVNTSPIATSAIKPIIGKSKDTNTPVKRVTFNLSGETTPTSSTTLNVSSLAAPSLSQKSDETSNKPSLSFFQQKSPVSTSTFNLTSTIASSVTLTASNSVNPATTGSAGFSLTPASTAVQPVTQKTESIISSSFNLQKQLPADQQTSSATLPSPSPVTGFSFGKPATTASTPSENPVSQASPVTTSSNTFSSNQTPATTPAFSFGSNAPTTTTGFSFGNTPTSSAPQTVAQSPAFSVKSPVNTTSASLFSFTPTVSTSTSNPAAAAAAAAAPTTTAASTTPGLSSGFNFSAAKPTFSFGNTSSPQVTASTPLGFGGSQSVPVFGSAAATSTQSTPSFASATTSQTTATTSVLAVLFGVNTSTQSSFSSPASTNSTTQSILSFGVSKTTEVPSFKSNTPTTTASSMFNGVNQTSSTQSLMFGGNNSTNTVNANPSTNTSGNNLFGQTKLPSFGSQPNLTFGANSNPTFGNNSTMTFGSQTTTTASFGSTTPATNTTRAPTFGSSTVASPAFGSTSTSSAGFSGFGSANASFTQNKTSLLPNTSEVFGSTSTAPAFGAPATTAPPSFGSTPTTAPPAFGATTTATPAFGSTSSMFGAAPATTAPPAFGASSSTPVFGSSATSPPAFGSIPTTSPPAFGSIPTTTPPAFGSVPTTAPPAFGSIPTTAPPAFGASTATPSFGASSTPAFGAASSAAKPAFGGSTAPPAFGATSTSTTPSFGASSVPTPSFGSSSAAPPAFGASNTFGSSSTPAFGSANTSFSGFGSSSTSVPFGSTVPSFGSAANTNNSNSNNSNNNNNNNSGPNAGTGSFNFGNTNPGSASQNPVYSFGGSGTGSSSAGSASTPFQFGNARASASTGGFNFNGAGSFNAGSNAAGGGGMFSIGSGSTAPRSRPARSRRQQR